MPFDPDDRIQLERFVADLEDSHEASLLAVVLTGDAATADYQPRKTPLTVIVVLSEVTPDALRAMRPNLRRWRRRRIPTPMVMDPRYIESSLDVFPLEFLDIQTRHRLIHGERDPFSKLPIDLPHLRSEVEEQLRGKLLHLWSAYLETEGSEKSLRALLVETPPGFEIALRGLLALAPDTPESDALATGEGVIRAVEQRFDVTLPTFERLEEIRLGRRALANDSLDEVFDAYVDEVRALVRLSDAL
jgi:hypothetical protein